MKQSNFCFVLQSYQASNHSLSPWCNFHETCCNDLTTAVSSVRISYSMWS